MSGRRGSRAKKPRTSLDGFLDLSLLLSSTSSSRSRPKSTRGRKKTTTRRSRTGNSSTSSNSAPMEVIELDDSWPPPSSSHIMENVNTKVDEFMVSGGFISSDDDDIELVKTKPNVKPVTSAISIFYDSDDDIQLSKIATNTNPGTSSEVGAGTPLKNNNEAVNPDDDIIQLVGSVLDKPEDNLEQLESYRKETEEMLNNVASFLDRFKSSDLKSEPVASPENDSKNQLDEKAIPTCPICLEMLSSKAAAVTLCGHMFCKECITQAAKSKKCPTCRKAISAKKIHPVYF